MLFPMGKTVQDVTGPDPLISNRKMQIGGKASWTVRKNPAGTYYIHLDPDGAWYTGCNGWGKAVR